MNSGQTPAIRTMDDDDIPGVFHLIDLENWGWEEHEIRRMFGLDREGSLIAESSGEIVGLVTGIGFGATAFIVHLIVKSDWRQKRLGTHLMRAALGKFDRRDITNIELHANPEALDFYRRLGFSRVEEIAFYSRPVLDVPKGEGIGRKRIFESSVHMEEMSQILSEHTGHDEGDVSGALRVDPPDLVLAARIQSSVDGLLLGRIGCDLNGLGPWVLDSADVGKAHEMLSEALRRLPPKRVDIIVPSRNTVARKIVEQLGFEVVNDAIVRVSRSKYDTKRYPDSVYAIGHFALI